MYLVGLHIFAVRAGIADVWVGQCDDLAAVRRVGQDFLIPGHRRIEHDLADGLAFGADRCAVEYCSVL